jgi:hypothetical protein
MGHGEQGVGGVDDEGPFVHQFKHVIKGLQKRRTLTALHPRTQYPFGAVDQPAEQRCQDDEEPGHENAPASRMDAKSATTAN